MPPRWYFVSLVFRFEPSAPRTRGAARKSQPVEENWELHRARTRAQACAKAVKAARSSSATAMTNVRTGEQGRWKLVGVKDCWLIYDDLADGCEIAWFQHGRMTAKQVSGLMGRESKKRARNHRR
jgi:hypothetical protein